MTTRQVHVRVDGEGAGPAEFLSDLIRVDIGDERDVRGPGGGARGLGGGAPQLLETEPHLPATHHERGGRGRRRRREVLVRRRQPGHEAPEFEVAEKFEHGGAVIGGSARALKLQRHG